MKATRNDLEFSTGKSVYINAGVIGLCIAGDDDSILGLNYGYDGGIPLPEDAWASPKKRLTPAECVELADEMLKRWAEFRAKYARA